MRTLYFILVCSVFASCNPHSPEMIIAETSNRIIKNLCLHDSVMLTNLLVNDESIDKNEMKKRKEHISDGIKLCRSFYPSDISKYQIRKDSINSTVFFYSVEIPFTDSLTGVRKGKVDLQFANYYGYDKASSIRVSNLNNQDSLPLSPEINWSSKDLETLKGLKPSFSN